MAIDILIANKKHQLWSGSDPNHSDSLTLDWMDLNKFEQVL